MNNTQAFGGVIQRLLFALFCLMVILAGGIFVLDQQRGPYHGAFIEPEIDVAKVDAIVPLTVAKAEKPAAPAKTLQKLDAEPDSNVLASISNVVSAFDGAARGHALESYLIWSVHNAKSDAYIDALLNSAASKGHFLIPEALLTLSGRLDTASLLTSIVIMAQNAEPVRPAQFASNQHHLRLSDSFAGLSIAYYGHPSDHARISDANGMAALMAEAQVGQMVEIPGL